MQWVDEHFLRPLQRKIFRNFGYYDYSRQTFCVNVTHVNHLLDGEGDLAARKGGKQHHHHTAPPAASSVDSAYAVGEGPSGTARAVGDPPSSPPSSAAGKRGPLLETPQGKVRLAKAEVRSAGLLPFIRQLTGKSLSIESVHVVLDFVPKEVDRDGLPSRRHETKSRERSRGAGEVEDEADEDGYESDTFSDRSSAFAPPEEADYDERDDDLFFGDDDNGGGGGSFPLYMQDEAGQEHLFRSCMSTGNSGGGSDSLFTSALSWEEPPQHLPDHYGQPMGEEDERRQPAAVGVAEEGGDGGSGDKAVKERFRTVGDLLRYAKRQLQGVSVSVQAFHMTIRIPPSHSASLPPSLARGTESTRASSHCASGCSSLPIGTVVIHVSCLGGLRAQIDRVDSSNDDFEASFGLGDWRLYVHRVSGQEDGSSSSHLAAGVNLSTNLSDFSLPLEDLIAAATWPTSGEHVTDSSEGTTFSHAIRIAHVTSMSRAAAEEARLGTSPSLADPAEEGGADPSADPGDAPPPPVLERRMYVTARAARVASVLTPAQLSHLVQAADAVLGLPLPGGGSDSGTEAGGSGGGGGAREREGEAGSGLIHPFESELRLTSPLALATAPLIEPQGGAAATAEHTAAETAAWRRSADAVLLAAASRRFEVATLTAATAQVRHSKKFMELSLPLASLSLVTTMDGSERAAVGNAWRCVLGEQATAAPEAVTTTTTTTSSSATQPREVEEEGRAERTRPSSPLCPLFEALHVPHFSFVLCGADCLFPHVDAEHAFPSPAAAGQEEDSAVGVKKRATMRSLFRRNVASPQLTALAEERYQTQAGHDVQTLFLGVQSFRVLEYRGGGGAAPSVACLPLRPTPLLHADKTPYALVCLSRSMSKLSIQPASEASEDASPPAAETHRCLEMYKELVAVVMGQLRIEIDADIFGVAARYAHSVLQLVEALGRERTTRDGEPRQPQRVAPAEGLAVPAASHSSLPFDAVRTHNEAKVFVEFIDGRIRFPLPRQRLGEREREAEAAAPPPQRAKGERGSEGEDGDGDGDMGRGLDDIAGLRRRPQLQRLLRHLAAKSRRYWREILRGKPASALPPMPDERRAALEELYFTWECDAAWGAERGGSGEKAGVGARGEGEARPRFLAEGLGAQLVDFQLVLTPTQTLELQWAEAVAAIVDPIASPLSTEEKGRGEKVVGPKSALARHRRKHDNNVAFAPLMRGAVKELLRVDHSDDMSVVIRHTDLVADGRVACTGGGGGVLLPPPAPTALRRVLSFCFVLGEVVTQPLTQDDYLLTVYFLHLLKDELSRAKRVFAKPAQTPSDNDDGTTVVGDSCCHLDGTVDVRLAEPEEEARESQQSEGRTSTVSASALMDLMETDEGLAALLTSAMQPAAQSTHCAAASGQCNAPPSPPTGNSKGEGPPQEQHQPQQQQTGPGGGGGTAVWWKESASATYLSLFIRRVTLHVLAPRLSPHGTALGEPLARCLARSVASSTDFALLFHHYQLDVSRLAVTYLSCDDPAVVLAKREGAGTGAEDVDGLGSTMDLIITVTSVELSEHIAPSPHRNQASLVRRVPIVRSYTDHSNATGVAFRAAPSQKDSPSSGAAPTGTAGDAASPCTYVLVEEPGLCAKGTACCDHHVCRVRLSHRSAPSSARRTRRRAAAGEGGEADEEMCVDVDLRKLGLHHLPSHMGDAWPAVVKNFFVDRRSSAEEAARRATEPPASPLPPVVAADTARKGKGGSGGDVEAALDVAVRLSVAEVLWVYRPQGPRQSLLVFLAPDLRVDIAVPDFTRDPVIAVHGHLASAASLYLCADCELSALAEEGVLNHSGKGWSSDLEASGFVRLMDLHPQSATRPRESKHQDNAAAAALPPSVVFTLNRAPHQAKPMQIWMSDIHVSAYAAKDSLQEFCKVAIPLVTLRDLLHVELPHVLVMRSNAKGALSWVGEEVLRSCAPMTFRISEALPDLLASSPPGQWCSPPPLGQTPHARRQGRACLTSFPSVQSTATMSTAHFAGREQGQLPDEAEVGAEERAPWRDEASGRGTAPDGQLEGADKEAEEEERQRRDRFRLWRRTNAPRGIVLRRAYQETMQELLSTPWPPPTPGEESRQHRREQDNAEGEGEVEEWMDLLLTNPQLWRKRKTQQDAARTRGGEPHGGQRGSRDDDALLLSASTSSFESVSENPMAAQSITWTVSPVGATVSAKASSLSPRSMHAATQKGPSEKQGEKEVKEDGGGGLFDLSSAVSHEPHYFSRSLHEPEPQAVAQPIDVHTLPFYLSLPETGSSPSGAGGTGPETSGMPGAEGKRWGNRRKGPPAESQRWQRQLEQTAGQKRVLPPVELELFLCRCAVDVSLYDGCDLSDAASRRARRNLLDIVSRSHLPHHPLQPGKTDGAAEVRGSPSSPPSPSSPTTEQALELLHRDGCSHGSSGCGGRDANKRMVLRLRGVSVQVDLFAFGAEEQRWLHAVVERATIYDCIAKSDVRTLLTASPTQPGDWLQTSRFLEVSWLNLVPRHASAVAGEEGGFLAQGKPATALLYGRPEEELSVRLQPVALTWSGASLDFLLDLLSPAISDAEANELPQQQQPSSSSSSWPPTTAAGTDTQSEELDMFRPPPLFFRSFTLYPTVITLSGCFDSDTGLVNAISHGDKLDVMRNLPLLSWLSVQRLPLSIPHVTVVNCGTLSLLLDRIVADSQCLSLRFLLTVCCCVIQPLNAAAKVGEAAKGVLLVPMAQYQKSNSFYHALARASTTLASELVAQSAHVGSMLTNNTYRASRALLEVLVGPSRDAASPSSSPPHTTRGPALLLPPAPAALTGATELADEHGNLPPPAPASSSLDLYIEQSQEASGPQSYRARQPSSLSEGLREGQDQLRTAVREASLMAGYGLGPDGRLVQLPAAGLRVLMGLSGGATAALRGLRNASSTQADLQTRTREAHVYKLRRDGS